ncbi:N-acetyltransferase family protein [Caldiplasma sukawensis]
MKVSSEDDIIIRKAKVSDAAGIIECMQSVMDEKIYMVSDYYLYSERGERELIKSPSDLNLVLEFQGKIVGILKVQRGYYRKTFHTGVLTIAIEKEFRNRGFGKKMIEFALQWAKENGIEKLSLEVFSTNENAISLYRSVGFHIEGVRKKHFKINGEYVDDVLMAYFTN